MELNGDRNTYGAYDLFVVNSINPSEKELIGTYRDFGATKSINLNKDLTFYSNGRRGTACTWTFGKSTPLAF